MNSNKSFMIVILNYASILRYDDELLAKDEKLKIIRLLNNTFKRDKILYDSRLHRVGSVLAKTGPVSVLGPVFTVFGPRSEDRSGPGLVITEN
jgi:hypothetical protein